jgi:hypothetical protein
VVYAAWRDTEVQSKNWRIIDQQFILVSFDVFPFAVMVISGNKGIPMFRGWLVSERE